MANEQPANPNDSPLITTLAVLFSGTGTEGTLRSGEKVHFYPAKMKTLPQLMEVFSAAVGALTVEELQVVIALLADKQTAAIKAGGGPLSYDLDSLVNVAEVGKQNIALFLKIFNALLGILPRISPLFTSLTEDKFDDLEYDEGILVSLGILGVNYPFFIRNLLPALTASLPLMMKKHQQMAA